MSLQNGGPWPSRQEAGCPLHLSSADFIAVLATAQTMDEGSRPGTGQPFHFPARQAHARGAVHRPGAAALTKTPGVQGRRQKQLQSRLSVTQILPYVALRQAGPSEAQQSGPDPQNLVCTPGPASARLTGLGLQLQRAQELLPELAAKATPRVSSKQADTLLGALLV